MLTVPFHPGLAQVAIEGRHAWSSSGALRLGFPGIILHLSVDAPVVELALRADGEDARFDVREGQGDWRLMHAAKGESVVRLPISDTAGRRSLQILRRNESWQGTVELKSLQLPAGGSLLAPPSLPERRILCIGDSITGGEATDRPYGEKPDESTASVARVSNARLSYGRILAELVEAQCHLVSYGGRGVLRDWQGRTDVRNAPQFYPLALPDDATPWNSRDYVPDVVLVGLGTNDFSPSIPPADEFIASYLGLLNRVRADFPRVPILLLDSPILEDEPSGPAKRSTLRRFLGEIASAMPSPTPRVLSLSHALGVPGDGHPTAEEQRIMADEILPVLRRVTGW